MATTTPHEAADSRHRGMLGWGGALLALGAVLLGLAYLAGADQTSGDNNATIFLVLGLVTSVPGLVLLQVGLVAAGVRLGLAAYGVAPSDVSSDERTP
ncbi:hypothetical protein [uncultured Nocardioides sp.]|uniref:hypothetical protein n=1 Tax=uncultured Nocardioides sp. TaxID=198441 RepID=UPI00261C4949|nr:hypothetical protein [uncultured Nocardioides sp.]